MNELLFAAASEQAQLIRRRQVSVLELINAHLDQIARHNPTLNAIVTLDEEGARKRAQEADAALARGAVWGPLHGVPVTIKDQLETAGMRTTGGYPPLADYVPRRDATVVARLRAAGAIILGKTNVPMLGFDFQTDNPIFGRSNNPWDPTRTPGGSTGGGAAAVAAGFSPITLGSDFAGSIRLPAHYCGLYGLKPGDQIVPFTGHIRPLPGEARVWRRMAAIGPLARSVEDLELVLSLIAGPDQRDWEIVPPRLTPVPARPLRDLHLAWVDTLGHVIVGDEVRSALVALADDLRRAGCHIERRLPDDFDAQVAIDVLHEMQRADRSAIPPDTVRAGMRVQPPEDDMLPDHPMTMWEYRVTLERRDQLIGALDAFFEQWDAFLCPVASGPAFNHCPRLTPIRVDGQNIPYWHAGPDHCVLFSLTGQPTVVLPLTQSQEGLPIGVQVVGRRWGEMELLAVAKRLAEVIGSFVPPPGY